MFLYDQLYLATVVSFETNPCHVFGLPNHLQSNKCFFITKKSLNELIIKIFDEISMFPSIHIYLILCIAKSFPEIVCQLLILPLSFLPAPTYLRVRQFGH